MLEVRRSPPWTALFVVALCCLTFFVGQTHAQTVASPPTAAEVTTGRGAPARSDPERETTSVGTAIAAMFTNDIATDLQVVSATQNILVTNRHTTQVVCVWFTPRTTAGATCALKCAADTQTCDGTSADGSPVLAGSSRAFPVTGELCACWRASGASTTATAERLARAN